jgi:hypothetical protein
MLMIEIDVRMIQAKTGCRERIPLSLKINIINTTLMTDQLKQDAITKIIRLLLNPKDKCE